MVRSAACSTMSTGMRSGTLRRRVFRTRGGTAPSLRTQAEKTALVEQMAKKIDELDEYIAKAA